MAQARALGEIDKEIVATDSAISSVDGIEGRLGYRGYDIHDLAQNLGFEETIYLLWRGELPGPRSLQQFEELLDENRRLPEAASELIRSFPGTAPVMDRLRTAVSLLSLYDPDAADNSAASNERKALRLTSQMGTVVAALARSERGLEPVAPARGRRTAWNFLYMLTGQPPAQAAEHALDVALVLHADHELNSSTYAARLAVETLSDTYAAVTAAIGAFSGPLHGGANVEVMHMLEQIGEPANAERYVAEALRSGRKLMGIGHQFYKTVDPRAISLRSIARQLADSSGERTWIEISEAVQAAADKALAARGKTTLKPNVDFFSAPVYRALGIPTDYFTSVFVISRIAGWSAHILEQQFGGRLVRLRANYTGPADRKVIPLEKRGEPAGA